MTKNSNIKSELEKALKARKEKKYTLHLYVAGLSPKSIKAIDNIRKICNIHLKGRFKLKIQDIYKNPIFAKNGQILGVPTLIKELPAPLRRFVGDMSDTEKLLVGLELKSKENEK